MKLIKFLVLAIAGVTVISCSDEFLNPLPDSAVAVEAFFQTDEDVLAGVIGIYDALQGVNENTETNIGRANRGVQFEHLLTEHRSDNTRNSTLEGSKSDFDRYTIDPNNVQSEDYYQSMYQVIFRANNILNFINVADEDNREKYAAEARFLRAYAYFNLVRLFGDVPFVTSVIEPTDDQTPLFTRIPQAVIYEQIIEDLDYAVTNLDNTYKSRASRAAAQGVLAKVYMTKENPDYLEAQLLCEAIMEADYQLEDSFYDVFYSELNSEIIFAIQYQAGNSLESQSFSSEFTSAFRQGRDDGQNIVNANLKQDFEAFGGNRTAVSITNLNGILASDENEVAKFLPEGSDITTSPPSYGATPRDAGNDYIALRYADVLLLHAEAILAGSSQTTSSSAIDSYMEVRVRAGFDPIADRPTELTKEALLLERRVELAFENQRWYDLIRFNVANSVLSAHASDLGNVFSARDLLLPIPSREINLSGGLLTQNPGY